MSQSSAVHPLRYLTTQFRSMQGLRLVPFSLLSLYDPASPSGLVRLISARRHHNRERR